MEASPDPTQLPIGKVLDGRFEILALLGRGSFARVYRVHDHHSGRTAAMKVPRWRRSESQKATSWFRREVGLVSRLDHPNVVSYLGSGVIEELDIPYLLTEIIDGEGLDSVLERRPRWGIDEVRELVEDVSNGLEHAWRHGIVHRDIKAANIMLVPSSSGERARYVLLDLGIAVRPENGVRLTLKEQVVGTPSSLAPEQLEGGTVDHRTDLYGVGVLMYRLLTGRAPFPGIQYAQLAKEILSDRPKVPSEYMDEGSSMIDAIVLKAMARDPRDRFQTAAELREATQVAAQAPRFSRALMRAPTRDSGEITARRSIEPAAGSRSPIA